MEHDIITRDAYSVSWAEIWEFSKSQRDIIDAVTISKKLYLRCFAMLLISASKPVILTFDLQSRKVYSLRSSFGMYNLESQLWYWHLLTRHSPCNLLPEPTSPKHEYREKLWGHPVTSSITSSPQKLFFHNLGRSFHIWGQIEAVFDI